MHNGKRKTYQINTNYLILLNDFHTSQMKKNIIVADCNASRKKFWQTIYGQINLNK